MNSVKPLFRYAGRKAKLLKIYYPFFQGLHPEHCIDYFGGSGTMSLWFHQLYPTAKLFLNEKDPAIYKLFKCIKENHEEFCQELRYLEERIRREESFEDMKSWYYSLRDELYNVTQDPSEEWIQADLEAHPEDYEPIDLEKELSCSIKGLSDRQIENLFSLKYNGWTVDEWEAMSGQNTPLEHAFYFLLRKLSFSGMNVRDAQGQYISEAGIVRRNAPYTDPDTLAAFKAMLDHAELFNKDYRELAIHLPRSLHYLDPPYVGAAKNLYPWSFDWDETAELCEYVQRLAEHSTVFMSNYDHPRLKKLMKGFNWYTFPPGRTLKRSKKEPIREILFYKIHPSIAG